MTDIEKIDSYLSNCLLKPREGEVLFILTDVGVFARLKDYAIIPTEEYEKLIRTSPLETPERYPSGS